MVFLFCAVVLGFWAQNSSARPYEARRGGGIFGGPEAVASAPGAFVESPLSLEAVSIASDPDAVVGFAVTDSATVFASDNPLSGVLPGRDGLLLYKVKRGDTLTKVASVFGISLNTILWANPDAKNRLLTPGQELVVLPVSGVLHTVSEGDTLETVSGLYGIGVREIAAANLGIEAGGLTFGKKIIIPGAKPKKNFGFGSDVSNLPKLPGYFAMPTTGWNWGQIHPRNAVDIANACGTPVYAAAEGLVVDMGNPANWNGGYGGFTEIEHPNGTATKYTHTQKNFGSIGDYVTSRELIAEMGNTGNVQGVSGCHLHFEVKGAANPLAK